MGNKEEKKECRKGKEKQKKKGSLLEERGVANLIVCDYVMKMMPNTYTILPSSYTNQIPVPTLCTNTLLFPD